MLRPLLLILFVSVKTNAQSCVPRSFGADRIVCVCNATYCDHLPKQQTVNLKDGVANWYVSNKEGLRMSLNEVQFGTEETSSHNITIAINSSQTYQQIFGFGGAITDSAAINIKQLSSETQENLLKSYFGDSGVGYTSVRLPIAGSDFSTRPYTYDDYDDDTSLKHFALAEEDYEYKIPILKQALELEPRLKMIAAAWTAPSWMKTVDKINGVDGFLQNRYYQLYVDYLLKFFDAYEAHGIRIHAISTGNEPMTVYISSLSLNKMGWTADGMSKWVSENLGPTLAKSKYNGTYILAPDDQTPDIKNFMEQVFSDQKAREYIGGIASHWYLDKNLKKDTLAKLHEKFSDKFFLMTEASIGSEEDEKVIIGSWERGEMIIRGMIRYLNNWYAGWFDWNIALDTIGGPTWINNFVDSPILVNADKDEFYKQPMFYAYEHVSRFVVRDSYKISIEIFNDDDPIDGSAFITPSNEIVVVLYNRDVISHKVVLEDAQKGTLVVELSSKSMNTLIYKL